jgi:hypothetical protein
MQNDEETRGYTEFRAAVEKRIQEEFIREK